MKPDGRSEKAKGAQKQKPSSSAKVSSRTFPAAASLATERVARLGRMSHAELMAWAQRHNKQLGLAGDVLAPVMRGVAEAATVRPPAVHPFTVGGAPRKDEYQAAWKSLSKRIGVPLFAFSEAPAAAGTGVGGGRTGHLANSMACAITAVASAAATQAAPPPTHAQMYGTADQPLQQVLFSETLASWLGAGPIDLPLLAPGAPPLPLRRLFIEVLEAGGTQLADGGGGGGPLSWAALAEKLQGDEKLGELLKQVYDAYLLPLERRLPQGVRPARVEVWMQEDLRRRAALLGERLVPSAEQVSSRLKAVRGAVINLQQQQHPQPASMPTGASTAGCQDAAAVTVNLGAGDSVARQAPAAGAAAVGSSDPGQAGAPAAVQPLLSLPQQAESLAPQVMQALRTAAVAAHTLLPGAALIMGGSKRARASSRGGRRGSRGGSRKRARVSSATGVCTGTAVADMTRDGNAGPEDAAVTKPAMGAAVCMLGADGGGAVGSAARDLRDPKAAVLLSMVASLRELHAGPPGCATRQPDLRANFMARWEELHEERAAAAAQAAAAAAAIPAGAGGGTLDGDAAAVAGTNNGMWAYGAGGAGMGREHGQEETVSIAVTREKWDGGNGGVAAHMDVEGQGKERAGAVEAADEGGKKRLTGHQRKSKRQRRAVAVPADSPLALVPAAASDDWRLRLPERKSDPARRPSRQAPVPREQSSRRTPQGREPQRPQPPPPQQREREREAPRNRLVAEEWRFSSPYPPPGHYPTHRALLTAAPLMSAAVSSRDTLVAALPPRPAHRPAPVQPVPPVPPAVQQHLEEMRRHSLARSHPINAGSSATGGDYYEWDRERDHDRGLRGPGGEMRYGAGGLPHVYARYPGGGGWEEGSGRDRGRGSGRGWDHGGPGGLH